jgi:hypothetical protein
MSSWGDAKKCSEVGRSTELLEQACDDPLRHAPDDRIVELVGLDQPGITGDIESDEMVRARAQEMVDRNPFSGCYLGVEGQDWSCWSQEHKGPHSYGWEDGRSGHDVIESSGQMLAIQQDSNLFAGLADRGREEILVVRLAPTARESHVATPGISSALGPTDQKDAIRFGSEDDGDGGPQQGCVVVSAGLVAGQALPKANQPGGQCECDWQPPPQQPPGGEPSRLGCSNSAPQRAQR